MARHNLSEQDKALIKEKYSIMTDYAISEMIGCSSLTVFKFRKANGLKKERSK
jgi:hypothetical protein